MVIGLVIVFWDTLAAYYDKWTRPAHPDESQAHGSNYEYFCPMHPTVVRDNPKEKCPICFMPLSKRQKGEAKEEALPPGIVNRVQLFPYRVVAAGIRTWKVDYVPLTKKITTVGSIEFNERLQKQVAARVKGRLDTLDVNETGRMVHAGDVLASIYSPDLVVAVDTLLNAHKEKNDAIVRISRDKLRLLDIGDDQIDEILRTGKADSHLKIRSPIDGHVIKKYVKEGQYVEEGMPLYDLADLSTVWIHAQIYEDDIAFLPPQARFHGPVTAKIDDLTMTATTRAFPNERFRGRLTFVHPHVDPETRTVTIRFELDNPAHKLRPGTTVTVDLEVPPKQLAVLQTSDRPDQLQKGLVLALPESAVIDTGSQQIVYRQADANEFEGVKVELGPRMTGPEGVAYFPVLRGLKPGDPVATAGSFLIDAETRLNPAAGSIYFGGSSKGSQGSSSTVRPSTPDDEDSKVKFNIAALRDEADQQLATAQAYCPIQTDNRLGSMGPPVKLMIAGQPVFVCCKGCKEEAEANPQETLAKVEKRKQAKKPT